MRKREERNLVGERGADIGKRLADFRKPPHRRHHDGGAVVLVALIDAVGSRVRTRPPHGRVNQAGVARGSSLMETHARGRAPPVFDVCDLRLEGV